MARITVEDCVLRIPSRFELVMVAAQRARDISAGASLTVDRDNDKNPVVALREIAEETVDLDHLRYEIIHGLRRHLDTPEDDDEQQNQQLRVDHLRVPDDVRDAQEISPLAGGMVYQDHDPEAAGDL